MVQTHLSKGPELSTKSLFAEWRSNRERREPHSCCCSCLLTLPISLQARGLVKKKDNRKVKKTCMTSTKTESRWYPFFICSNNRDDWHGKLVEG